MRECRIRSGKREEGVIALGMDGRGHGLKQSSQSPRHVDNASRKRWIKEGEKEKETRL